LMEGEKTQARERLQQMISGYWFSQALGAVVRLNIPDLLQAKPLTAAELAPLCGAQSAYLSRLMRGASAVGVFHESSDGKYSLTPMSELLVEKEDGSGMKHFALHITSEVCYFSWAYMDQVVKSGVEGCKTHFKKPCWDVMDEDPLSQHWFNKSMTGLSRVTEQFLVSGYDWKEAGFKRLVDVGGGFGHTILKVLEAPGNEHTEGICFDIPKTIQAAQMQKLPDSVASRFSFVEGDFFKAIPEADGYLLKNVLHDWNDTHTVSILKSCSKAMQAKGRVLIIEFMPSEVGEMSGSPFALLLDLHMMAVTGGKERTRKDWQHLFSQAGLALSRVIPLPPPNLTIIEAVKA